MSDALYHSGDEPPNVTIWQRINRLLAVLIVLAMVAGVIGGFLPQLQKQRAARAEEARLKLLIEQRRKIVLRQTRELNWLKNDPSYVEIIARDRLDLMKDGETIYRLDPPKTPAATPPPAAPSGSAPGTPRRTSRG